MKKIIGTTSKPRVSIYHSNSFIYGQAIDDSKSLTVASASTIKIKDGKTVEKALQAGKKLGEELKSKKVDTIVYDRNGNKYHGAVAAFADGLRQSGIKF